MALCPCLAGNPQLKLFLLWHISCWSQLSPVLLSWKETEVISNARILVADDDAVTRTMIVDKLSVELGHRLVEVADGLAAIAELQRDEFDLVITDIMMPDITGQGVLEAVRHESPDTEVVVITGFGNVEMAIECLRAGAMDFLEKPFKIQSLVNTVERALERRRARLSSRRGSDPGEAVKSLEKSSRL